MGSPACRRLGPGRLRERAGEARRLLGTCRLCVRACGRDRLEGERRWCRAGRDARISGFGPHFGEEPPLVGHRGSGTILFSHCTLGCVFCQNWETSLDVMRFLADEVSRDVYVNIMDQYRVVRPAAPAELERYPCLARIQRSITEQEYGDVVGCARRAGLRRFAP